MYYCAQLSDVRVYDVGSVFGYHHRACCHCLPSFQLGEVNIKTIYNLDWLFPLIELLVWVYHVDWGGSIEWCIISPIVCLLLLCGSETHPVYTVYPCRGVQSSRAVRAVCTAAWRTPGQWRPAGSFEESYCCYSLTTIPSSSRWDVVYGDLWTRCACVFLSHTDIHEFYELTLENAAKPDADKAEEVRQLTQKWEENDPPIPLEARRIAQRTVTTETSAVVSGSEMMWVLNSKQTLENY